MQYLQAICSLWVRESKARLPDRIETEIIQFVLSDYKLPQAVFFCWFDFFQAFSKTNCRGAIKGCLHSSNAHIQPYYNILLNLEFQTTIETSSRYAVKILVTSQTKRWKLIYTGPNDRQPNSEANFSMIPTFLVWELNFDGHQVKQ